MGKTSTERSRLSRKKLKDDVEKYDSYKSKDKERKRAERSKPKKLNPSEIERRKQLNRERVKKFKLCKKAARAKPDNDEPLVYKTPQALGKAEVIESEVTWYQWERTEVAIPEGKRERQK